MRGKRILAVILSLVMILSLGAGFTVNAASPITFTGTETVLFDYYFGDLTSTADAKDLDITGNWEFTPYFMSCTSIGSTASESVTTKESYNLTDASGFIFETKLEILQNTTDISLPGGYKVTYTHNGDGSYITLSKDGEVVAQSNVKVYMWSYDTKFTVKYISGKWNINIDLVENGKSATIEYDDESNPELIGKFGVTANNAYYDKFTMYSMKLTKIGGAATVNNWKYEHTFSADDTVESLAKEGITFYSEPSSFESGYVNMGASNNLYFAPTQNDNATMFTGDYVFKTKVYKYQNNGNCGYVRFNVNGNEYYEIHTNHKTNEVKLRKITSSGTVILDTKAFTDTSSYGISKTYEIEVKVYNSTDSTRIVADFTCTSTNETVSFDYSDTVDDIGNVTTTTTDENGEEVSTTTEVDTGAPITSGTVAVTTQYSNGTNVYYIKANSLLSDSDMSEDTPVQYVDTLIDKSFSSSVDTVESLATEGISFSNTPTINSGSVTMDGNDTMTYTPDTSDEMLTGDYTLSTKLYRNYGHGQVRLNINGSNYYTISVSNADNGEVYLYKNGKAVETYYFTTKPGGYTSFEIEAKVYNSTASTRIVATVTHASAGTVNIDYTDTDSPITSGKVAVCGKDAGGVNVYYLKVKTYADSWEENVIDKTFSSADNATTLAAEGITTGGGTASYDDTDGIYWTTSGSRNNITYTNDTALKGSYSFSEKHTQNGGGDIILRFSHDGSNYYQFKAVSGSPYTLSKVYNGTTYTLWQSTSNAANGDFRYGTTTLNGAVTVQSDGSVKIDFYFYNSYSTKTIEETVTDSLTDVDVVTGTDTEAPITSGTKVYVDYGYTIAKVYNFALTKYNTSKWFDVNTGELIYTGRFFDGAGNGLSKLQNGAVYFDYPVARLGSYKVIATLYENNEMTDIKVLDPIDLYAGKVRLFTVTDADNANVKVFFFDSEEGLNKLTEVYELN